MKSICFFNNKGGVGKTTLICNVASYLATKHNLRVLVVDADPQCNSTQLILGDEKVGKYYNLKTPKSERPNTLFDVLRPIGAGEADIDKSFQPSPKAENRFGVDLLPGHPAVALMEDRFSQAWLDLLGRQPGGFRKSNWNTQLCKAIEQDYDFAFYDVGPSLGALNRTVLVGVDFFVSPMGCDVFSIMGIENISKWLTSWLTAYASSLSSYQSYEWDVNLSDYPVKTETKQIARFIGYTVQQYITKSIRGGERRPTAAYEKILKNIPGAISKELGEFVPDNLDKNNLRLGDVPNMFSLVPLAQKAISPIHGIESRDGLVGAQFSQKEKYTSFIGALAGSILSNVGMPSTL